MKKLYLLFCLIQLQCTHDLGLKTGRCVGIIADRSISINGHTLLDTVTIKGIALTLLYTFKPAILFFDVAGNPSQKDPLNLDFTGIPDSNTYSIFEKEYSEKTKTAYINDMILKISEFLKCCQMRMGETASQRWTDLIGPWNRIVSAMSLPIYKGWYSYIFEQSDGLQQLPGESAHLFCPEPHPTIKIYSAGRAPEAQCDSLQELGSTKNFNKILQNFIKNN